MIRNNRILYNEAEVADETHCRCKLRRSDWVKQRKDMKNNRFIWEIHGELVPE